VVRKQNRAAPSFRTASWPGLALIAKKGTVGGIGGYHQKYFIAKNEAGEWELIESAGSTELLQLNWKYKLRLEAVGSQLRLFEGSIQKIISCAGTGCGRSSAGSISGC